MLAHSSAAEIALGVALILIVVPAALIDLEHRIIPNRITALGAVVALVIGLALDPAGEPERLIAAAAAGGFLLLAALAYPGGMGMGDVKLAGGDGAVPGRGGRSGAPDRAARGRVGRVRRSSPARARAPDARPPSRSARSSRSGPSSRCTWAHPLVDLYVNHFVH